MTACAKLDFLLINQKSKIVWMNRTKRTNKNKSKKNSRKLKNFINRYCKKQKLENSLDSQ
jgi:hypothetical protein